MSYKFARIFLSGFRSAPINPEDRDILISRGYSIKNLNKMYAKNITLFSKYEFTDKLDTLSGFDDIYDAEYVGQIYEPITGLISVRDSGYSDASGQMMASGYNTGIFIAPQKFYSKAKYRYNQEIYPIYNKITFESSPNTRLIFENPNQDDPLSSEYGKKEDITGWLNITDKQYQKSIKSLTYTIGEPFGYRQKVWEVVYTGFAELSDYFYDPINKILSFYKIVPYRVTGAAWPRFTFTVVTRDGTGIYPPGIFVINKYLQEGSGYIEESGAYVITGTIPNYPLLRKGLSGFANITGKITGVVLPENSGYITISGFQTKIPNPPGYQFIEIGYQNATGILNYNNPQDEDFIRIENDLTPVFTNTFTYKTDNQVFTPPNYFNSIEILNNIINSGSGNYGIYSEIIDNKLKLTSSLSGDSGNYTKITTFGSENRFKSVNNYLTSGKTFYRDLHPTGLYTAYLPPTNLYATGIFAANFQDVIYIDITGKIGYKDFTGSWDIFTKEDGVGFVSAKENNNANITIDKIESLPTEMVFGPQNLYTVKVTYENTAPSTQIDMAKFEIFMNNTLRTGIIIKGDKNYGI